MKQSVKDDISYVLIVVGLLSFILFLMYSVHQHFWIHANCTPTGASQTKFSYISDVNGNMQHYYYTERQFLCPDGTYVWAL
jgi:hypothetical protein